MISIKISLENVFCGRSSSASKLDIEKLDCELLNMCSGYEWYKDLFQWRMHERTEGMNVVAVFDITGGIGNK